MKSYFAFLLIVILFFGCKKEVTPQNEIVAPSNEKSAMLYFSGYQWIVKNSPQSRVGPGPNFFSSSNVFVDSVGYLHMKIQKTNNKWFCSELLSNINMGYGKYIFVTKGNVETFDKKTVVGLFTWDDNSYQTAANDELDIEFSKWGNASTQYVMEYSVQPTYGASFFPERTKIPTTHLIYDPQLLTTHVIEWRNNFVRFESHTGDDTSAATLTHSWIFNNSNIPRQANQGGVLSNPIVIPLPGATTKAHFNFWLIDKNKDGKGDAPSNGLPAELIIKRFQYVL